MGLGHSLLVGLREVILLRQAEARARAAEPEHLRAIASARARAKKELSVAREIAHPADALPVLELAFEEVARGHALALALSGASPKDVLLAVRAAADDGPDAAIDSVRADPPGAGATVREIEARRESLEAVVGWLATRLDGRGVAEIRAARAGRVVALVLLLLLPVESTVRARLASRDLALHRPVTASSLRVNPPTGAEIVDGKTRGTFGVHTNDEDHPWVMVDLGDVHRVQRVSVFNRGDGWFDDVLPIDLEVSKDGVRFDVVAARTEHFDRWDVDLDVAARYVRLRKPERGYIAINEIEVFGK